MNEEIRTLDLFSGIGGFSLGLEWASPAFRTVAFCERDPFAQRVLRKHWPEVPIYDDVKTIPTDGLGRIDLVTGGFPCQPWSVAGKREGAKDKEGRDLWPAMVTLIKKLRPRFVLGENVRGFVNEPMGLERSLSDLESIGYKAVTFIISAIAIHSARHRRDRVWILAHSNSQRCCKGKVQEKVNSKKFRKWRANDANIFSNIIPSAEGVRGYDGVSEGLDKARIRSLGNAVVPQVVEQIGKAILEGWSHNLGNKINE